MNHIETVNPANQKKIAEYPLLDYTSAKIKVERSHKAFLEWRQQSLEDRSQLMKNVAELLLEKKNECARLITTEMGKPIKQAESEIEKCALVCNHYAKNAAEYLVERIIRTERKKSFVCYQPLGVIFAIMPWNYPFWQVFRFAAPNIMAGNTAILKHAPISCGAGEMIEDMFLQAGFPEGIFQNIVVNNEVAASVIGEPHIVGVTLTGSARAGRSVSETAGSHLKKVVMELGGSDPYLILEDADLDLAADCVVQSRLNNAGQVCIAAKRILVDKSCKEKFMEKIAQRMSEYKPMNPMLEECKMGPMARLDLRDTVHEQVQRSIQKGAKLIKGGTVPEGEGFFYPATLLDNICPGMPAFDEELFGPVIALTTIENEQQGIALANNSSFGLGASVFTRDIDKGEHIARNCLEAGACFVNSIVVSDPRLPFGGIKQSGYGRELSAEGMHEFVNIKTVVVDE